MEPSTEPGNRRKTLILVGALVALFALALVLLRRATDDIGADQPMAANAGSVSALPPSQLDAAPLPIDAAPEVALGAAVGAPPMLPAPKTDGGAALGLAATPDAASDAPKCIPESKKELCGDGADNNCNGQIDEGCPGH